MNEAQFSLSLGFKRKSPPEHPNGLRAPALDRGRSVRPKSSCLDPMIETSAELAAQVDASNTLADKALPTGRPGAVWV